MFENASVANNLQKGAAFHVKNRKAATRNETAGRQVPDKAKQDTVAQGKKSWKRAFRGGSSQGGTNKIEKSASQHGKTSSDAGQSSKNPQGKKKSAIEIQVLKDEGKCFF